MARLNWAISRPEYGFQFEVTANTRVEAIAKAEAKYLSDTSYEDDIVGNVMENGEIFTRSSIPDYTAKKI